MRPTAVHAVVLSLALALCAMPAQGGGTPSALAPGDEAPLLRGTVVPDGQKVQIDWAEAKLTVLNFWATWCTYCKDQMPVLQQLWSQRQGDGLRVLGVYAQEELSHAEVAAYYQPLGVEYPILEAHKRTNYLWGGINALPTSFLIDARGKILRRYVGATPEQIRGLVADVEAVLEGRPMGKLVMPEQPAVSEPPATAAEQEKRKQEVREHQP